MEEADLALDQALGALQLTDTDRGLIQSVISAVTSARDQVPKGLPVKARRAIAGVAVILAVAAGILTWAFLEETADTGEELAAALIEQRDATLASCDKLDKVDHAWDCRLTYVRDPAGCRDDLERVAARDLRGGFGVAVAVGKTLNQDETQKCIARATSRIHAYEAGNGTFIGKVAELTITESNKTKRRGLRKRMSKRFPNHFGGRVPEQCTGVGRALALVGRC